MNLNLVGILIVVGTFFSITYYEKQKTGIISILSNWIPGILLSFILPAIVTNSFGLSLEQISLHDWSKKYLYPLVIICIMSSMSLTQIKIIGLKPLILFLSGSLIISTIPVVLMGLVLFFDFSYFNILIDEELWKGFIPVVGSWIGGSSSMLVLQEYISLNEELFLSVLFFDTLLQNIVMIFLFQSVKKTNQINRFFNIDDEVDFKDAPKGKVTPVKAMMKSLGIILGVLILFRLFNFSFLTNVIWLSIIGLVIGNALKFWDHKTNLIIGSIGIILIMSILGLKLKIENFDLPLVFIFFIVAWMVLNMILLTLIGLFLKTSFVWTPIALMANIGGISTSPALASAYDKRFMPHAIVLAILSMATGTFWGLITTFFIQALIG
jgi:uncharacterized membrane protein|tara:strand:+ start:103 stop:1245 length:1143 start_codon:yes stop_codon:yes gene_type:complete